MLSRLSELTIGQKARVLNVDAAGEIGQRILEMGMTPGTEVRMAGAAPWATHWSSRFEGTVSVCDGPRRTMWRSNAPPDVVRRGTGPSPFRRDGPPWAAADQSQA